MRRFLLLLIVLSISVCAASPAQAANILYNGDFETASTDARGWTVTSGMTAYSVVADDPSAPGSNSIQGVEPEPGGSLGRLLQEVNTKVVPGESYRLTGWIKTTNVTAAGGVVIGFGTTNASGALISGSFSTEIGHVTGTTNWQFFDSGDFTVPAHAGGTVSYAVYIDFNGSGGGTARFDDVSLEGPQFIRPNPIWLDFAHTGVRAGTESLPVVRLMEAAYSVASGGDVNLVPGQSGETLVMSRPVRLVNADPGSGVVIVGEAPAREPMRTRTGFVSHGRR